MSYDLVWLPAAERDLKAIRRKNPQAAEEIGDAIEALRANPRPGNVKAMAGSSHDWRVDVRCKWGSFRVVYEIDDGKLIVLILAVGDRKDVYRKER